MTAVFSGSVGALVSRSEKALARGNVNVALRIVHDFVERIITEPICVGQVFSSRELDRLCVRIGSLNFLRLNGAYDDPWLTRTGRPRVVYLVSRLQRSGGHSRLLQDFIRAQPEKDHLVISTGVGGGSDDDYFVKVFEADENVRFIAAPHANFQLRLTWTQRMLAGSNSEHVHLLNNHQDSVAVAALVPEMGLQGSFHHHGDHHLCLGVHMGHLTHIDLHPMGYHYCREVLGIDNRYLPLTFEDQHVVPRKFESSNGQRLTTATAARSNKIEISYYVSYLDIIPRVIKVTGGRHIHIGKLTPWALMRMRRQLRKYGIAQDRLVYIEWTPSVWKSLQEHSVDVYIASFPFGAGLTLIETMGAGVPVIMHQYMYSRVLSGLELAYPEAFRWTDPEDLLVHLSNLKSERLQFESRLSRQRYEAFHRPEILTSYLNDPESMKLPVPPLMKEFTPRYDEWAAWAEAQLCFSQLAYRLAYRVGRKIRSLFS